MWVTLAALALGAENPAPVAPIAAVHALAWNRSDPAAFEPFAADADPEVRRAAAVGLGRLRNPAALGLLEGLAADPDAHVASAAREALGFTPGSAAVIRRLLGSEPAASTIGAAAARVAERRGVLLRGLGRQGDATDLPRLTTALSEPGVAGAAAADAIARLARRKVDPGASAVPALVDCLVRMDPAVVEACAHALKRVDTSKADRASAAELEARWSGLPTGTARAWALRPAYERMEPAERTAALTRALADPDPLVRIAALDVAAPGDLQFPALAAACEDPRTDVRAAAVSAMGRLGGENGRVFLDALVAGPDPWLAAIAVEARIAGGAKVDPALATDPEAAPPVRAAVIAALAAPGDVLPLTTDASPIVRSAAAGRLAELGVAVAPQDAIGLLTNPDLVVRQAALEILAAHDARTGADPVPFVGPVTLQLRVDTDPDALVAGFNLLSERARRRRGDVDVKDNTLKSALARGLSHADAPVREAARKLADELGYADPPAEQRRDFPEPNYAETMRIRSAVVITNRGEFRIELWPEVAPVAVWNFARLAESNFYDETVFHRVVPGFVVQGGDPRGDGSGGPDYTIPDEVSDVPFATGGVGMARSTPFDTGGSQWFVTTSPQPALVGDYTQFGQVTDGLHVARQLARGDHVVDVTIERRAP